MVMRWWRDVFGCTRDPASVTPAEIHQQLIIQIVWAGSTVRTVNLLRAVLVDFYAHVYGPAGPNPARAVPRYGASKTSQIH